MRLVAGFGVVSGALCMAGSLAWMAQQAEARQAAGTGGDEIPGVVRSSDGTEAGVSVIAETEDRPTKFVKIAVTDDDGRFLLPDLLYAGSPYEANAPHRRTAAFSERQQVSSPGLPASSSQRAVLDTYCVPCHNQRTKTAGLMLDALDLERVSDGAATWEKVVRKLRARAMPPPGRPRPHAATYDAVAGWLETALDSAAASNPNPGRPAIHRLNVAEYTNAIRDLLALEIDGRSLLPRDDADQHGFDNIAGILSVSPVLLERYLAAARRISRLAIGDSSTGPAAAAKTYRIPKLRFQDDRMSEDLPFGSRGGIAMRHHFPLDGEYIATIRLRRTGYGYVRGLGEAHELEVRLDGERLTVFRVGGERKGTPAPASYSGNILSDSEWEEYMISEADAGLEVRFPAKAGTRVVAVLFVRQRYELEGALQPPLRSFGFEINESGSSWSGLWDPGVDSVSITGPYRAEGPGDTPSRRQVFVCRPKARADEKACAERILATLARRAYRRPVTEDDVRALFPFYEAGRRDAGFDAGIQLALQRLLVDPDFLFRVERDPAGVPSGTVYRITDVELASRLSFFLWSSLPDEKLLDVAVRGKLKDPAVLEQQVRRMLADERLDALVENFAAQWLALPRVRGSAPDPTLFPDFDENLREAFERETELFVASQLREDRSIVDLLTANYTFVNERLAQHYQIPKVYGSHFRRVPLDGTPRAGLLSHGSILTVTSYGNRTSPVLRGKWLLDNILGYPPPSPPPDVPSLSETDEHDQPASARERMEQHRKRPACASCHTWMDPLGFALENFDAVGHWRSTDERGAPFDVSGALPGGPSFEGLPGLRALLLSRRDEFVRTVTEKMMTYALGRAVEYYDQPAIRRIMREAAPGDHRWSALILGIVESVPFQMRRTEQ